MGGLLQGVYVKKKILSVTIHDCRVDTFRAGGKGGQNQNVRDTGVRVVHEPSGAKGESREQRSQLQNKRTAFRRMGESDKFLCWIRIATARALGQETIEDKVDRQMQPSNLLIETYTQARGWENYG